MNGAVELIEREERKRVQALVRAASSRPKFHVSTAKVRSAKSPHLGSAADIRRKGFSLNRSVLGYSSTYALGDAVRKSIVEQEEFRAQQGHCRILMKDGVWLVPESERPTLRIPNDSSPEVAERSPDYRRNLLVAKAGSKVVRA